MSTIQASANNDREEENETNIDLQSALTTTVLKLEEIDKNLYRGTHLWKPIGGRAVFGGQVVGQALVAAGRTKPENVHVHSLHCYFIRPGQNDRPILYHVERERDGTSFSSRTVKAVQNGESLLTMLVSYHKHEQMPLEHQHAMPKVPPPEDLLSDTENLRKFLELDLIPERYKHRVKQMLARELPFEVKPVDPATYYHYVAGDLTSKAWIRAKGHIGEATRDLHRCAAAYMSDYTLLRVSLNAYPGFQPAMMASLDHSMWFHSDFRADEWMLYESESPRLVGARALTLGRLWKRDGTLAVSVAQEGVVRGSYKSRL